MVVGFAAGYDLIVRADGHRFGFYAAATTSELTDEGDVRSVSIGAAYRYW